MNMQVIFNNFPSGELVAREISLARHWYSTIGFSQEISLTLDEKLLRGLFTFSTYKLQTQCADSWSTLVLRLLFNRSNPCLNFSSCNCINCRFVTTVRHENIQALSGIFCWPRFVREFDGISLLTDGVTQNNHLQTLQIEIDGMIVEAKEKLLSTIDIFSTHPDITGASKAISK